MNFHLRLPAVNTLITWLRCGSTGLPPSTSPLWQWCRIVLSHCFPAAAAGGVLGYSRGAILTLSAETSSCVLTEQTSERGQACCIAARQHNAHTQLV